MNDSQPPDSKRLATAITRLLRRRPQQGDLDLLSDCLLRQPQRLLEICRKNVIPIRTFEALSGHGISLPTSIQDWLVGERKRVQQGLELIQSVTELFDSQETAFMVIKTGDHYPDQGHDIDLYLDRDPSEIGPVVQSAFEAKLADRSFSEAMAGKRNFKIGHLALEVHCRRLGQVGEHRRLATEIFDLRSRDNIGDVTTWIPSSEGRLILAMLQRVYRHFNFRICDVINVAQIVESSELSAQRLDVLTRTAGIRSGVELGVGMVEDLLERLEVPLSSTSYPGHAVAPEQSLSFHRDFFRFSLSSVVPKVYLWEFTSSLGTGAVGQATRLSLLAALMPIVGLNIRLAPAIPLWRRLW